LNLINSSIEAIDSIKRNQKPLIIDLKFWSNGIAQFDTFTSVSPEQIGKYLSYSDTIIEKLIKGKTFRNLKKSEEYRDIDYYYQNNKFHFYNTKEPDEIWSQEEERYVINKTYGEDILVVDNILEIFGSFNDGHFVLINDSVFFYVHQLMDKVGGPFKIDNISGRWKPIHKYYHEYSPINRFILFIDNYNNTQKSIFFPDSNLVISNYDSLENEFINSIFKTEIPKQKDLISSKKLYLILTILLLSIILNFWLLKKK